MRPDDPMTRSGAKWCEIHHRWECSARKENHHATAMRGQAYCLHHVGKATDLARAEGEAKLAAWSLEANAGQAPRDLGATVMQLVAVTAARVEVLSELVRTQVEAGDYSGLVGTVYAAGRDGARVEIGERVRALVKFEAEERDRLVRYSKTAHDMGIAEQHIVLEQAKAEQVVSAVRLGLDAVPDLLPAARDAFLRAFLSALGRGPEVTVVGEVGV